MAYGFGGVLGAGTTDRIRSTDAGLPTQFVLAWKAYRRGGTNSLRAIAYSRDVANDQDFYVAAESGSIRITRGFSTTNSYWTVPDSSDSIWHSWAIVINGTSTPIVYKDGLQLTVTTVTAPVGTPTDLGGTFLFGNRGGSDRVWDGMLAEIALYSGVTDTNLAKALSTGAITPSLLRNSLLFYYPLVRNARDFVRGTIPTIVGTVVRAHPRVFYSSADSLIETITSSVTNYDTTCLAYGGSNAIARFQLNQSTRAIAQGFSQTSLTSSITLASTAQTRGEGKETIAFFIDTQTTLNAYGASKPITLPQQDFETVLRAYGVNVGTIALGLDQQLNLAATGEGQSLALSTISVDTRANTYGAASGYLVATTGIVIPIELTTYGGTIASMGASVAQKASLMAAGCSVASLGVEQNIYAILRTYGLATAFLVASENAEAGVLLPYLFSVLLADAPSFEVLVGDRPVFEIDRGDRPLFEINLEE
jgi:hypothetical protein